MCRRKPQPKFASWLSLQRTDQGGPHICSGPLGRLTERVSLPRWRGLCVFSARDVRRDEVLRQVLERFESKRRATLVEKRFCHRPFRAAAVCKVLQGKAS